MAHFVHQAFVMFPGTDKVYVDELFTNHDKAKECVSEHLRALHPDRSNSVEWSKVSKRLSFATNGRGGFGTVTRKKVY